MNKTFLTLLLANLAIMCSLTQLNAGETKLNDLPPVVIRTFPVAGTSMVDPSTRKIYIIFSQKMTDNSWSFVMQDKATFPTLNGKPEYDKEKRTCTLNVSLEPDKTYILWINSSKFANFKGENGKAAVPYMLSFRTAGQEFTNKKNAALTAADTWLELLKSAKFADSWKAASPYFQKQVSEGDWVKQITYRYNNMGGVKSRKLASSDYTRSLPRAPEGEYFILRFATSFGKKPNSIETVVLMRTPDGAWKTAGYFIK